MRVLVTESTGEDGRSPADERDPWAAPVELPAAFITLGLVFNATGTAWNIAVAWFAGIVGRSTGYARGKVWLDRAIGVLFLGIGVKLALAERP
jgi:threonine/homoserine/homoserine lactone efflux protein